MSAREDRFWSKVNKEDECWLWCASTQSDGYGQFWLNGSNRKAHRVAYEWANGPIPEGMQVDHICRVRACVNPAHLRLVTNAQNAQHQAREGRLRSSRYRGVYWHAGERSWRARAMLDGKEYYLGRHDTEEDAAAAASAFRAAHMPYSDEARAV